MTMPILGIDIAQGTFDVELQCGEALTQTGHYENNAKGYAEVQCWLKKHKVDQVHACLEATGRYGDALAEFLVEEGHQVSMVNPLRIKAYAESRMSRNKTDPIDAHLIAHFCRTQNPSLWTPPSAEWKELQSLARHLEDLQSMRQQEQNRLLLSVQSLIVLTNLQQHIAFL